MKKTIICLLSLLLVVSLISRSDVRAETAAINPSIAGAQSLSEAEKLCLNQMDALNTFATIKDTIIFTDKGHTVGYDKDYGGCYINSKNELVVCIKEGGERLIQELNKVVSDKSHLKYTWCVWSREEALIFLRQLPIEVLSLAEYIYFDSELNKIVIESSADNIAIIQRLIEPVAAYKEKNSILSFRIIESAIENSDELNQFGYLKSQASSTVIMCGGTLFRYINLSYTGNASVGICGSYMGDNCILTAAHVAYSFPSTNYVVNYLASNANSALLATTLIEYGDNGDITALKIPTGYTPSNLVTTSNYNTTGQISYYFTDNSFVQGMVIHKYGFTTGFTSGTVAGDGFDGIISNLIKVNPLTEGTSFSLSGDSGAPVWFITPNNQRIAAGIIHGGGGINSYTYFTPIRNALDDGFIPYGMSPLAWNDL